MKKDMLVDKPAAHGKSNPFTTVKRPSADQPLLARAIRASAVMLHSLLDRFYAFEPPCLINNSRMQLAYRSGEIKHLVDRVFSLIW